MLYLLAGCIDYALNGEKQVAGPVDSADTYLDSVTDTYDTVDERCPTEPLPGFPGSSDSTCAATNHAGLFDPVLECATAFEYPVIADVDGDGSAEIVLASNDTYRTGWHGIHVIGDATSSWRPGRPEWNQYAYSLTNINDDLSVPTAQAPNWASYNNFRSGDPATGFGSTEANPTLAPGDVCQVDCNDGRLVVWIHPGNTGAVDQRAGSTVSLYSRTGGIETLLETQATGDLPAGTYSESLVFDISGVGPNDSRVARISVPDPECVEADDELVIDGPFCP